MAPGVVGAAHERTGFDVAEAELLRVGFQLEELIRSHVALDGKLIL